MSHPINDDERLAVYAAREIADGEVVFVGIGIPSHAAVLAKRTHAPAATLVYESGAIGALPRTPPLSTGSPEVAAGAAMIADSLTVFAELQAGRIDVGMLSGAQVDLTGALNSTVIGPYAHPKLRMVGSGGAHDIAMLARRVLIVMPHEPRRFVRAVDFVTSPGLRANRAGTPARGPACVVTSRARFDFGEDGRLRLEAVRRGLDPADVVAELDIGIEVALVVREMPDPDPDILWVLRRDVLGQEATGV